MPKFDQSPDQEPWQGCDFACGDCETIADCRFAHWSMDRELQQLAVGQPAPGAEPTGEQRSDLSRLLDELGETVGVTASDFLDEVISPDLRAQPLFYEAKQLAVQAHAFWTESSCATDITAIEPVIMELAWHAALVPARSVQLVRLLADDDDADGDAVVSLAEDILDVLDSCLDAINRLEETNEEVGCGPALDLIVGKIAWLRVELMRLRQRFGKQR